MCRVFLCFVVDVMFLRCLVGGEVEFLITISSSRRCTHPRWYFRGGPDGINLMPKRPELGETAKNKCNF